MVSKSEADKKLGIDSIMKEVKLYSEVRLAIENYVKHKCELCRKEVIDNIKAFQKAIPLGKTTASYNTIHKLLDYLEELEKKEAENE